MQPRNGKAGPLPNEDEARDRLPEIGKALLARLQKLKVAER